MGETIFSPMVTDAIGEIMNISLGSSATAVSNMLDHRVDITTPSVQVVNAEDFVLGEIEPAVGVEITLSTTPSMLSLNRTTTTGPVSTGKCSRHPYRW